MPQLKFAVVGSESLLGRDVQELVSQSGLSADVKLIGADEDTGVLTERDGEPVLITELTAESLRGMDIAFLTGSAASARRAFQLASTLKPGPPLIDLTYGCEDLAGAQLRAPMVEPLDYQAPAAKASVIAHPAAIGLCLLLMRLEGRLPMERAIVTVFEPASERGQRGLDELQKQTINLFSFHKLPREVFDAQLAFNMLARLGSDAPQQLDEIESRIRKQVAGLQAMGGRKMAPSIRLVQAPVFHGYSFSVWAEFEKTPRVRDIEAALASPHVDVRDRETEAPANAGMAGQSGIAAGAMALDPAAPRAAWLWAALDNFRLMSENAIAVARGLVGGKT
jgi:aspartate-semialdehyde dehydrogenase